MENAVFFVNFILEAGIISKFVLVLLLFMSIYSWSVIFAKFFQFRKVIRQLDKFVFFLSTPKNTTQLIQLANRVEKKVYSPLIIRCLNLFLSFQKQSKLLKEEDIANFERIANIQVLKVKNKYKKGLSLLAITSSAAPFIGLFGTVVGIIKTFSEIALQKSTSLAVVAPGIAEALVATGLGIFVAIPALVFYNHFSEKLRNLLENFDILSMEIFNIFKRSQ